MAVIFSFIDLFTFANEVQWVMSGLGNVSLLNWLTTCSKYVYVCGNRNTANKFLVEGSETPDICCERALYSFSPYVHMLTTNFKFGHWWNCLVFARCEELIPNFEIECFFRLQQPVFKSWFLRMTFYQNLMRVCK